MVARRPSRRIKKVRNKPLKTQAKKEKLKDEVEKMEVEDVAQVEQEISNKPLETEVGGGEVDEENNDDESDHAVEMKDPLHQVKRKRKIRRSKKKPKKAVILNILKHEISTAKERKESKVGKSQSKGKKSEEEDNKESAEEKEVNVLVKSLTKSEKSEGASKASEKKAPIYHWGIAIHNVPVKWKEEVDNIIKDYKQFNLQAYSCKRLLFEGKPSQELQLFFNSEEDMKRAVLTGNKKFLGKALVIRTTPVRTVYISGIPLDIKEESARLELKAALGKSVYDITFPKAKHGKMLGYGIAYIIDESDEEELLNDCRLELWGKVQQFYSKEDFFNKYVLYILLGSKIKVGDIFKNKIEKLLKKANIEACVDGGTKKAFFSDEQSVQKTLERSGLFVNGKKVIFSRSPAVQVIVKNIKKDSPECDVMKLFDGIKILDEQYNKFKCKVTLSVRIEDVEKCKALQGKNFNGRDLEVYQGGSEQYKLYKDSIRKKFEDLVNNKRAPIKPGSKILKKVKMVRHLKSKQLKTSVPAITKKVNPLKKKCRRLRPKKASLEGKRVKLSLKTTQKKGKGKEISGIE